MPREVDGPGAELAAALARDHGIDVDDPSSREIVEMLGAGAPGVLPALFRRSQLLPRLAAECEREGSVGPPAPLPAADASASKEEMKSTLRRWRDEALVRVTLRELHATVDVDSTAREWSGVAAECVDRAVAHAEATVARRWGAAVDDRGAPLALSVLGMGKLGGQELNLGSDIDLCFFYESDDGGPDASPPAVHFGRVGSAAVDLLADVTDGGFAYRVDLRLRPEGRQGPIACARPAAVRYYQTWGRPWERAALLRARTVAGDRTVGNALLEGLRGWIFRSDEGPFMAAALHDMLARARRELLRDDARDLKLGTGGIREAEFFVQSLQLRWGGAHPVLQVPSTLRALHRLRTLGLVSDRDARDLDDAWGLLRRVEHRVQAAAPYATHELPDDPRRLGVLARSLGYRGAEELVAALDGARARVRDLFSRHASGGDATSRRVALAGPAAALARWFVAHPALRPSDELVNEATGSRDPEAALTELRRLARRPDLPLGADVAAMVPEFAPRLLDEVRDAPDPDLALAHLASLFERVHPAERLARWLLERPTVLRGMVGVFGASKPLSRLLLARPELIERFVTSGVAPEPATIRERIAAAAPDDGAGDDPEEMLRSLRRAMRDVMLAVGVADLAGELGPAEVAERLSALAESLVAACAGIAASECAARWGAPGAAPLESLAVVALGSLAARELGHGGDLDLLFLHDHADDAVTRGGPRGVISAGEFAIRMAQRTLSLLSSPDDEGPGYAIDTRLRPSGSQGVLVTSRRSFLAYHGASASWERQALLRARPVAGDPRLCAVLANDLWELPYLRGRADIAELRRLRARMELELGREDRGAISLKYARGGLVDTEFVAQALQLAHGADPAVRTANTRAALLALRASGALDDDAADSLLQAESSLRTLLHATRVATSRGVLIPSAPSARVIARRLGYRDRAQRSALDTMLRDLARTRDANRRVFRAVMNALEG